MTSGFIAISITNFTGCFYKNTNKDASHISETELKQLEGNVDDVVKAYFKEKYDVQAAVIYQTIAGGVFLGPDPSAEQYYNLTVSIIDGEYYTECNAKVYGKRVNKKIELYVKNESYYGKLMNDKMIQWIDPYISKNDLNDSRCAQRELCEAILKRSGENRSFSHKKSGSPAIFALTFCPRSCIIIAVVKVQNFT